MADHYQRITNKKGWCGITQNNSVYILTAEAKDLYNTNHLKNGNGSGYCIRTKAGNINVKKFINALDYSLDLIKLREIYEKI